MAGRSHLSIGEVLSLLHDEFPDVTISKIRFLESQGLVDPERTPSGYRKFYDSDIERLRWVLRQQRDAFLPLKVIKGRLDNQPEAYEDEIEIASVTRVDVDDIGDERAPGEPTEEERSSPAELTARLVAAEQRTNAEAAGSAGPGSAGAGSAGAEPAGAEPASAENAGAEGAGPQSVRSQIGGAVQHGTQLGAAPSAPIARAQGGRRAPTGPGPQTERGDGANDNLVRGAEAQLFDAGPPYTRPSAAGEPESPPGQHARASAGAQDAGDPPGGVGPRAVSRHGRRRSDGTVAAREDRSLAAHRASGGNAGPKERASGTPGGDSGTGAEELTLEELLEETGADLGTVQELEGFALITPKVIGGSRYYTRDAATVTKLASAFARHGVEARHLRAYKGAADREAGLVEQVIMPLIRQRNPEARQAAAEAVEELSTLGGELRAALLRSALADLH